MAEHLVAHAVAFGNGTGLGQCPQARVEVFTIAFESEVKRHVVDAGREIVDLAIGKAEILRELKRGSLHAVAQPDGPDAARA